MLYCVPLGLCLARADGLRQETLYGWRFRALGDFGPTMPSDCAPVCTKVSRHTDGISICYTKSMDTEKPTTNERGDETHPAWGLIGASRVSSSPPGAALFDSDIRHQYYVVVRLRRATRRRDLGHDWKHGEEQIVEIAMSEAQWASFVSSMNVGDGVPCTIERIGTENMPRVEYEPRLAVSMEEVRNAATRSAEKIEEAFAAYREKKTAATLRNLEFAIKNLPANMNFTAETLSEHAENVVQRARADIEAMVISKAKQLGIEPGDITDTQLLDSGNDPQES